MRSRSFLSWLAGSFLFGIAPAEAGTLTSATWVQTLSPLPWLMPIQLTRTTAQLGATGTSTAGSISASLGFPPLSTSLTVPTKAGMAFVFVTITQGGAQVLTATPGMASGTPGIPGVVVVGGTTPLLTVPLHHGFATKLTLNRSSTQFAIGFFYGWIPNTVTVKGLSTYTQTTTTQFVAKGSFDLTGKGGGTVTLVSPAKLYVVGDVGIAGRIHSFTTLTLHFVPEPTTLLLCGAGALAAAWSHAQRRASPSSRTGPAGSSPWGALSTLTKARRMGDSSRGSRV